MSVPSEFALFHYGKKVVMIPKCTSSLMYLVFVSDTRKPSIVLYFKGLENMDFPVLLAVVQASDSMTASM